MKAKITILTLIGLILYSSTPAQTNAPAGDQPAAATQSAVAEEKSVAAPPESTPAPAEEKPAAPPTEEKPTVAPPPEEKPAAMPAAEALPAAAPAAPQQKPAPAPAATPVPQGGAVIPLIQFQDVPLTTAIENLARQAGINYMLDPRVGYGQPDEKGQIKVQPNISIRWENVTAEQALLALLNNYGLQLVEDPKTKIARITIKDPAAPEPLVTHIVQLKYASVSNMIAAVQSTLTDRRSKVVPDARTSQLIVVATEKELANVDGLINMIDTPTRQVLIEAQMFQMSSTPSSVKGIDWVGTLQNQNFSFGNGVAQQAMTVWQAPGIPTTVTLPGGRTITTTPGYSSSTALGGSSGGTSTTTSGGSGGQTPNNLSWNTLSGLTPAIGFLNADGLHAALSFLSQDSDAEVISTPRIVTLDNQPAAISSGLRQPIRDITASTANTTAGSTVTYEEIGTELTVTPRISANDYIYLNVMITNRDIVGYEAYSLPQGGGGRDPVTQSRQINTLVLIRNANTLVMGGLINDSIRNDYTKIPVMGDIPVLGYAFRHESKTRTKENMLVFITPTIVRDADFQPTETHFLQSRSPKLTGGINPNSLWDSGKPYDWSKPRESASGEEGSGQSGPKYTWDPLAKP